MQIKIWNFPSLPKLADFELIPRMAFVNLSVFLTAFVFIIGGEYKYFE